MLYCNLLILSIKKNIPKGSKRVNGIYFLSNLKKRAIFYYVKLQNYADYILILLNLKQI